MSVKSTASFAAILIAGGTVGSVITTALRAQSTPPAYLGHLELFAGLAF
jgi:hypothetical protein